MKETNVLVLEETDFTPAGEISLEAKQAMPKADMVVFPIDGEVYVLKNRWGKVGAIKDGLPYLSNIIQRKT